MSDKPWDWCGPNGLEKLSRKKIPRSKETPMTDLQAKIDALPEIPTQYDLPSPEHAQEIVFEGSRCVVLAPEEYEQVYRTAQAALARLALAREWVASQPHAMECPYRPVFVGENRVQWVNTCTCGRDALLKAMEVPA